MEGKIASDEELAKRLAQLQAEAAKVNERRAVLKAEIEHAREELEVSLAELEKEFQTRDLRQIAELIAQRDKENEDRLAAFEAEIKSAKEQLDQIAKESQELDRR